MKVGILTQPLHNNYGGILQNYALQTVLKRIGCDPITIDIQYATPSMPPFLRVAKMIWRFLKKMRGDKSVLFCDVVSQTRFLNTSQKEQSRFIKRYIQREVSLIKLDKNFLDGKGYQALIVGSDQVWRPRFSPYIANYFLDFTEGHDVLKLSYAASFGTDTWEGTTDETPRLAELACKFDAISVREKSGIEVCKNVFDVSATWVLDPTLLLTKNDYQQALSIPDKTEKTLAVYVLDITPKIEYMIDKISKEKKIKVNIIGRPTTKGFPSIESWLSGIFNCDYVLTDSFHGTVFSILAHKPFITIVNTGRGASRFESLLGALDLLDHLVIDDCTKVLNKRINFDEVEAQLAIYRQHSMHFLTKALHINE